MAIDSKAKRMSMLAFASPLAWQHHFEVDGAVDADDRAHLLHLYGGNALSTPGGFQAAWARFSTVVVGPAGMGPTNYA